MTELLLLSFPSWLPGTILAMALIVLAAVAKSYRDLRRAKAARRRLDAKYPDKPKTPGPSSL